MNPHESLGKISSIISVFEYKWKLDYDSEFNSKSIAERVLSSSFHAYSFGREIEWCIVLYPKGDGLKYKDHMSIYLYNLSCFEFEIMYLFSFLNKDNRKVKETSLGTRLFKPGANWGLPQFIEQSFVADRKNNLVVDGQITVVCQIIIKSVQTKARESFNDILDDFEKLFLDEKFKDFTVISSDNKELQVHKGILASRSPVFEAMFQNDMIEQYKNSAKIEDVEYDVLLEMFRYVYSNKVIGIEKILCELLYAAEKYSVEGLKLICEETMLRKLNKQNAIVYIVEADRNHCSNVKSIREFIVKHSSDIVKTMEFKSFIKSHPGLTYDIINDIDKKNPSN